MFKLDGKITLVTGAASGIGAAIAEIFAKAGATVYIADRDNDGAVTRAEAIRKIGGSAEALKLDVTSEVQCAEAAARVETASGPLDILVNNAGIGAVGNLLLTSGEDMDRLYAVNVRGVFNVTKAFLPGMVKRKAGNIINLASVGGLVGIRDRLAYCTSKFAVVGMTKSIALDYAAQGIRVNCICPGRVETPFVTARLKEYPDPEKAYQEMSSTQLFGRMIKPAEVAAAALYLASEESYMVTGTTFLIDCGWTAGK
jgi:NAD(P)-dependent dehydrogenase (short-subunit alcohol dehydrogenase family)